MEAKSFGRDANPSLGEITRKMLDRRMEIERASGFLTSQPIPATAQTENNSASSAA